MGTYSCAPPTRARQQRRAESHEVANRLRVVELPRQGVSRSFLAKDLGTFLAMLRRAYLAKARRAHLAMHVRTRQRTRGVSCNPRRAGLRGVADVAGKRSPEPGRPAAGLGAATINPDGYQTCVGSTDSPGMATTSRHTRPLAPTPSATHLYLPTYTIDVGSAGLCQVCSLPEVEPRASDGFQLWPKQTPGRGGHARGRR